MASKTNSPLPPLYARWFDEMLRDEIPVESRATCSDCAMCESPEAAPAPGRSYFDSHAKCCTYTPWLYSFLVGMILTDQDPAMTRGRASLVTRLNAGLGVTPFGLEPSRKFELLYGHIKADVFGRAVNLRCPHYVDEQGGLCGIWKYRNSVCSTWFCKFERGATGRQFWELAKHLLIGIEEDLARWCALKLDVSETALRYLQAPRLVTLDQRPQLSLEDLAEQVDPVSQQRLWGQWYGREQEYFSACAELVTPLTWADVMAICGPSVQLRAQLARKAFEQMSAGAVPARLRMGNFKIVEATPSMYSLHAEGTGMDMLKVSARVVRLLPYFDGRPTTETLDQITATEKLRISNELLHRLADFKILVAA